MRDPHVKELYYKLQTTETLRFSSPPPITGEEAEFKYLLDADKLTVKMKSHFASAREARFVVEQFLRAWELNHALSRGRMEIDFKFEQSKIVDRDPPKLGEPHRIFAESVLNFESTVGTPTITTTSPTYPLPPTRFLASPGVEGLWLRYERSQKGREPLLSMAYVVLSFIEGTTGLKSGARNAAATMYAIDRSILSRFGELVSTKGNMEEARKLDVGATNVALTSEEISWLRNAVLTLIRRKAEYDADPSVKLVEITMKDI